MAMPRTDLVWACWNGASIGFAPHRGRPGGRSVRWRGRGRTKRIDEFDRNHIELDHIAGPRPDDHGGFGPRRHGGFDNVVHDHIVHDGREHEHVGPDHNDRVDGHDRDTHDHDDRFDGDRGGELSGDRSLRAG